MSGTESTLTVSTSPSVAVGMMIRRPAGDVFRAIVDPTITSKFWFTKGSGPLVVGARVQWEWEMYDMRDTVEVTQVEQDRLVRFNWGIESGDGGTVTFTLTPLTDGTYVDVTETDFPPAVTDDGDKLLGRIGQSSGGFAFVLSAMKAWLEHEIVLRLVLDHVPKDLDR